MKYSVDAVVEGPRVERCGKGTVDERRDAAVFCHFDDGINIEELERRIGGRLEVHETSVVLDGLFETFCIGYIDPAHVHPILGEKIAGEAVRAAVDLPLEDGVISLTQKRKERRRGTRAGSIAIYCGNEALKDAGFPLEDYEASHPFRKEIGVYLGITEHGNVETENEVWNISQFDNDVKYWSHHHNPRTVANNAAGELCLNAGLIGPHMTVGAACAAGNYALINAAQSLMLGDIKVALAGGISESIHTFGIFASFNSQGALAKISKHDK